MSEAELNVDQVTIWRNLLDAFAQLDSTWEIAAQAQQEAEPGAGPGALHMPAEMVAAFAHAGHRGARVLQGVAQVLASQHAEAEFSPVRQAAEAAEQQWERARSAVAESGDDDGGAR
jgi:hypothetical protein